MTDVTHLYVGIARCNETDDIFGKTLGALERSSLRPAIVSIIDNGDVPLASLALHISTITLRPGRNMGCAGSWNHLLTDAYRAGMTPVILNADTAVAPDTLAKIMQTPGPAAVLGYGFGCFRIDSAIFEAVGPFDEDFYPVYCEDVDYRHRMKIAGVTPVEWPIFPTTDVAPGRVRVPTGIEHGKHDAAGYQGWSGDKAKWFAERLEANKARYVQKWGGTPYEEKFARPFERDSVLA